MQTAIKTIILLGVILLACNGLWGCKGGEGVLQPGENQASGSTDDQVRQALYKGRVVLPDGNADPTKYKVIVPAGTFDISPDGEFEITMNTGTTGLITVIDANDNPVLFKVFPKHNLLLEQEPVVNAESTAVAFMYLNPIVARYNNPLHAAILLELLRQTKATPELSSLIATSLAERRACTEDQRFSSLVAQGLDELFSLSDGTVSDEIPPERKGQADDSTPWFHDRDWTDVDRVSISGFGLTETPGEATIHYENDGYKWWMGLVDPTGSGPDYQPDYSTLMANMRLIKPRLMQFPTIDNILEQFIANSLKGIINQLTGKKENFIDQLLDIDPINTGPSKGDITLKFPKEYLNNDTFQFSLYSLGTIDHLGTTNPPAPGERLVVPALLQIFYQLVFPAVAIACDVKDFLDAEELTDLLVSPAAQELYMDLGNPLQKLNADMKNGDPAVIDDSFEIAAKILTDKLGKSVLEKVLGKLPSESLNEILKIVLVGNKALKVLECGAEFVMSIWHTFEIPNFDCYVIDLTKYCYPDENQWWTDAEGPIAFGETVVGATCMPNDVMDWYWFHSYGPLAGALDLDITNKAGEAIIALYSKETVTDFPNTTPIEYKITKSPNWTAQINLDPLGLGAGDYYVVVGSAWDYLPREYKFVNNGSNSCIPDSNNNWDDPQVPDIGFGENSGAQTVCKPDDKVDWYKFTSGGDLTGNLKLTVTNGTGVADITLYSESQAPNPDGPYLKWKQANPSVIIDLAPLELGTGTYYVRIRHIGDDYLTREYTFENNGNGGGPSGNGWARTWGGTGTDYGYGVATDSSGNVYVTGWFAGSNVNFNPGGLDLHSSNAGQDVFISKFNSSGTFQWASTWGGIYDDRGVGVATDSSGNVYVTGYFWGTNVNFDPGGSDPHSSNGEIDVFISKFNSSGTFQWVRTWGGTNYDIGRGVSTDSSGDVYVTGYFAGTNVNFDPGGSDPHSSNDYDIFISKFNSSGAFQWARTWGGPYPDWGYGVATDSSGNVYVTGYFWGTNVNFDPGGSDPHSSNGGSDVFISKFNSSGNFQWARTWGGTSEDDGGGVATDSSGNVYVTGYFWGTNVNFNPGGSDPHSSNGDYDVFISKFNSSGNFQWARTWGGISSIQWVNGYGVATDGSGNIYATGYFDGTNVNFDPDGLDPHSSHGYGDVFISKFNSSGTFQWARTWGGTSEDDGGGVATDNSGNVYVTGYFAGTNVNFNPGGSDPHSSNGDYDVFLSKFLPNGYW